MLKDMEFEHVQVASHHKKWFIWEINLNSNVDNIPTHMIVSLKRPEVDEDRIKKNVTYRYHEKLKDSLFSKEVRKQIEEESKSEIYLAHEERKQMVEPIIFHAWLSQYKNGLDTKIVLKIDRDVGLFIYKKSAKIEKLLLSIDQYPDYLRGNKEVDKIVEEFENTNEWYFNTKELL